MAEDEDARHGGESEPPSAEIWGRETGLSPKLGGSIPERIAGYALKRVIASGGMGTVYLAVQDDPRRTVALKVMKPGISSLAVMRRFKYEAQILARLRHPNIAQVYDAGKHHTGESVVPFFAMEYIPNARSIIEYARAHRLETRRRLEMFALVCEAVHHGHQKGVIHRDLKPENILVESDGTPKIIDFGVARATDSDLAVTTLQTDVGQIIGTVAYMSPEQCRSDPHDLDARSDVYSLGVVLFELLCEQLPYDVVHMAIHDASRVICDESPRRPSDLLRTLAGDVETITLKALEKDRCHRYQTALDLAGDIRRYLASEPITARPPSLMYQLRMFARRHRAAVLAMKAVGAVLVIATIVGIAFVVDAGIKGRRIAELEARDRESRVRIRELEQQLERLERRLGEETSGN